MSPAWPFTREHYFEKRRKGFPDWQDKTKIIMATFLHTYVSQDL